MTRRKEENFFIIFFSISLFLFVHTVNTQKQTRYFRWEKEPVIPHPRNTTTTQRDQPIKVVIAHPYKNSLAINLPFIIDGILLKLNQPIEYEAEEVNLKKWRENNSIIITGGSLNAYFDELEKEKLNLNIGVVHLKDSFCPSEEELPYYNQFYSKAKFVLRNYYCASYFKQYKNVYFLPIGWGNLPDITMMNYFDSDDKNTFPQTTDKGFDFVFIGAANPNRSVVEMIISGYDINKYPHIFHVHPETITLRKLPQHWVPRDQYNHNLMNSHFGLVVDTISPPSIESSRFYEVISHGAIPLALQGEFMKAFDYKFPVIKNWRRDLVSTLDKYLEEDQSVASVEQLNLLKWWKEYLIQLRLVTEDLLNDYLK